MAVQNDDTDINRELLAMGKLTTHILDTTRGTPGQGIHVSLYRIENEQRTLLRQMITNDDGRCDEPLASDEALQTGVYELLFAVGPYFDAREEQAVKQDIRFLDDVLIRFGVPDAEQHYHVPLLITPFSYSTYRGS